MRQRFRSGNRVPENGYLGNEFISFFGKELRHLEKRYL
jgi:hypothetical protein